MHIDTAEATVADPDPMPFDTLIRDLGWVKNRVSDPDPYPDPH
jgi:hypothetical protein